MITRASTSVSKVFGLFFFRKHFAFRKSKCNFAAIVKENIKYSVSTFSRLLLCLLAVFYVSIFVVEATHSHANLMETVSADGEKNGPETSDCKICAYVAHHENEMVAASAGISFALFPSPNDPIIIPAFTNGYQAGIQHFINRGPPCSFV